MEWHRPDVESPLSGVSAERARCGSIVPWRKLLFSTRGPAFVALPRARFSRRYHEFTGPVPDAVQLALSLGDWATSLGYRVTAPRSPCIPGAYRHSDGYFGYSSSLSGLCDAGW